MTDLERYKKAVEACEQIKHEICEISNLYMTNEERCGDVGEQAYKAWECVTTLKLIFDAMRREAEGGAK